MRLCSLSKKSPSSNGSTSLPIGGIDAAVSGEVSWRHAFGALTPISTSSFTGGSPFDIAGVLIARDAAVTEVGLDFHVAPNATLGISYNGSTPQMELSRAYSVRLT
ncbi:MAG: autotransporter outer membrane beta-barrel domain-containing protein [Methylovirgula sp.]|uniref:autotransporter outer membrane beta-barrel domain-containing protein n=1 Tax=Methylovirgula sp. TaxID=1978224 RepID=UPI003075F41F